MALRNTFKHSIRQRELQIGLWSSLCSPVATELLSHCGFDWLLYDSEHSPVDVAGLLPLLQAGAGGTAHQVVRPAANDPVLIKRVLDLGAQTILVPFVQNGGEARDAVAATRYPPHGIRGVAGATRASRYGRDKDYLREAGEAACLLVQIETQAALSEIEAIATTDGVDGVFIGPSDLAASLGHIGNPGHPDVQRAIKEAGRAIEAAEKPAGILANSVDAARNYIDWGFTFVAVATDLGLLSAAATQVKERFKENATV